MKSKIHAEKIIALIKSRDGIETKQICAEMNITIGQWQLAQPFVKSHCYRQLKKWYMTVVEVVPPRIRKSPTATIVYRMMPVSQMGLKERLGMHKDAVWRALKLLKAHNLIHITGYETSNTTIYPIYDVGYGLDATRPNGKALANERSNRYKNRNIEAAKTVAGRLDFLTALDALVFGKESKRKLLERDQLHKMLENEAWLFHEEFALAGSEQRLEEVLHKHLSSLGPRQTDSEPVRVGDDKQGRVDLMLSKASQPRSGEYDFLIVELKRPTKKIDADVITQIEKYAIAVANDERFRGVPAKWTFIAISNDLDSYAQKKANQRGKPKGQVYDDAEQNITVWVKSWADVINDAKSKLDFINQQLSYEADRASAKEYLQKAHSRFIPEVDLTSDGYGNEAETRNK